MKSLFCPLLCVLAAAASSLPAQPASPAPVPDVPQIELFAARTGETRLADKLNGVRLITSPAQLGEPGFPAPGVDASRVPTFNKDSFAYAISVFLNAPVSQESLERLVNAVRLFARMQGRSFLSVYLPPQDITGGYVQIVAGEAIAEGDVMISGARYFAERQYHDALRQQPGQPIDEAGLQASTAWLNRNPFRQVTVVAESGSQPGTTRLALRTRERLPFQVSAGYDNTGSAATDENRVFAGVTWGNALWRGDLATYRLTVDPKWERSESHSGSYTTYLPWRHTLTAIGAWSRIESEMPLPFSQVGHSWQAGLRYDFDLRAPRAGWSQNLTMTADFKYSDNNLEFADIPITDNVTHVVQASLIHTLNMPGDRQQGRLTTTLAVSPAGLSSRNHGRYFELSRAGAKANYVYGRIDGQYSRAVFRRFLWSSSASVQYTDAALLGSEQLSGAGAAAVRGYRESSAFGDWGIVSNNELHLPPLSWTKVGAQVDPFAFADFASLRLNVDEETVDLRSLGLGANLQWRNNLSVRASYGWQVKQLDRRLDEHGAGHLSASVSW